MNSKKKTRIAYGYHRGIGKLFDLGDTVDGALRANMMVKDYEQAIIKDNPQLEVTFKIEWR